MALPEVAGQAGEQHLDRADVGGGDRDLPSAGRGAAVALQPGPADREAGGGGAGQPDENPPGAAVVLGRHQGHGQVDGLLESRHVAAAGAKLAGDVLAGQLEVQPPGQGAGQQLRQVRVVQRAGRGPAVGDLRAQAGLVGAVHPDGGDKGQAQAGGAEDGGRPVLIVLRVAGAGGQAEQVLVGVADEVAQVGQLRAVVAQQAERAQGGPHGGVGAAQPQDGGGVEQVGDQFGHITEAHVALGGGHRLGQRGERDDDLGVGLHLRGAGVGAALRRGVKPGQQRGRQHGRGAGPAEVAEQRGAALGVGEDADDVGEQAAEPGGHPGQQVGAGIRATPSTGPRTGTRTRALGWRGWCVRWCIGHVSRPPHGRAVPGPRRRGWRRARRRPAPSRPHRRGVAARSRGPSAPRGGCRRWRG